MVKHVILGAGGSVGTALATEILLQDPKSTIVLVSRRGTLHPSCISLKCDLTDVNKLRSNLDESCIAYMVAGLAYDTAVWEAGWPPLMESVVKVCKEKNVPLIFLDNVYMLGKTNGEPMTEETPINPCSRKGEVRARVTTMLLEAWKEGLRGCIIRSADFYGPYCHMNSNINGFLLRPLVKGKASARWVGNSMIAHSFTYVPDVAKAMVYAGSHPDLWERIWHAPTCGDLSWTGQKWATEAGKILDTTKVSLSEMGPWTIRISGIFIGSAKAAYEMLYQNMKPYIFDSSAFEEATNIRPTSYEEGLKTTIEWLGEQEKEKGAI